MKILYISDVVYPYTKGGSEIRIYQLSKRLSQRNHEVYVLCGKFWAGSNDLKIKNITYFGFPILRKIYFRQRSGFSALSFTLNLRKIIAKLKLNPDIVEFNQSPMIHLVTIKDFKRLKKGAKVIGAIHEIWNKYYWIHYTNPLYAAVGYYLTKFAISELDHIITISNYNKKRAVEFFGCRPEKISVIRPGVDYKAIVKCPPSTEQSDLIFVGRLVREKGITLLPKTIRILKEKYKTNVKAIIVGDGPLKKTLIDLARRFDVQQNLKFTGTVEKSETIYSYLKSSKVFVYPAAPEGGWSIAILEANAAGLPVITSKESAIGVASEIIVDGYNGFQMTHLNAEEFAYKVQLILNDEALRKRMAENSVNFAARFDWDNIANETLELYNFLCNAN